MIQWARGKRRTLARVGELTPAQAREKAEKVLGNVRSGKPALRGLDSRAVPTLGDFIKGEYAEHIRTAHKKPQQTLQRLKRCFSGLYNKALTDDITADLEVWKSSQLRAGASPSSVRRDLATLVPEEAMPRRPAFRCQKVSDPSDVEVMCQSWIREVLADVPPALTTGKPSAEPSRLSEMLPAFHAMTAHCLNFEQSHHERINTCLQ